MDEKTKEDLIRKRQERMGKVIRPAEIDQQPVSTAVKTGESKLKTWMTRQCYHVQINADDIEFLERYTYWRKVANGGKGWTISDTLTDALRMLAKHTPLDVKPIPDWVPRRKRKPKTESQPKE